MKTVLLLGLLLAPTIGSFAQAPVSPSAPAAPEPAPLTEPASVPELSAPSIADPGAAPPVVRLPGPPARPAAAGPASANAVPPSPSNSSSLAGQIGWSSDQVELRAPTTIPTTTNRVFEARGVVPKIVKPERRGFGGFISGFANLFNPFAPMDQGVAADGLHWYDSQINGAPLPRGFRDERYHEAKTELFVVGTDGRGKKP